MTPEKRIKVVQTLERIFWTFVVAAISNLLGVAFLDLDAATAALLAGMNAVLAYLLILGRYRLSVLPDPGQGLPGLPIVAPPPEPEGE